MEQLAIKVAHIFAESALSAVTDSTAAIRQSLMARPLPQQQRLC
jgi:hypothetical protein